MKPPPKECPQCHGSGIIFYDENHGKPCAACCPHPPERHYHQGENHPSPGALTCGHCGTKLED